MLDTTYLDSNAPPPESPLVLLGSDPKEELALYKDVPKYSDRLAVELSRLRKYSDFKGNPFLYNPNDYIEAFRSLPIWMRNFSDKFVYPKSDFKDETLLVKEFELRNKNGLFGGMIEKEYIEVPRYRVLVERRIFGDFTDILVICNTTSVERISVALRAKGPSVNALIYELSEADGAEVVVPGPYEISPPRMYLTDFSCLTESFFERSSTIENFRGGLPIPNEDFDRIRNAYVRESQPPLFEMADSQ